MRRRHFLSLAPAFYALRKSGFAQLAEGPDPIPEPHFPSRLYLFVWRNWELANADRMAKVIQALPEAVLEIGRSMGLPPKRQLTEDQLARTYITAIRQNWHVLPQDQIVELLAWTRQRFEFTLKTISWSGSWERGSPAARNSSMRHHRPPRKCVRFTMRLISAMAGA